MGAPSAAALQARRRAFIASAARAAMAATLVGVATMTVDCADAHAANSARDGSVAIREEYDLAIRTGTREALRLFLARHPDSDYAKAIRDRLQKHEAR